MLPDQDSEEHLEAVSNVLILVVMEDAPRLNQIGIFTILTIVLILVVMEDAPRQVA